MASRILGAASSKLPLNTSGIAAIPAPSAPTPAPVLPAIIRAVVSRPAPAPCNAKDKEPDCAGSSIGVCSVSQVWPAAGAVSHLSGATAGAVSHSAIIFLSTYAVIVLAHSNGNHISQVHRFPKRQLLLL